MFSTADSHILRNFLTACLRRCIQGRIRHIDMYVIGEERRVIVTSVNCICMSRVMTVCVLRVRLSVHRDVMITTVRMSIRMCSMGTRLPHLTISMRKEAGQGLTWGRHGVLRKSYMFRVTGEILSVRVSALSCFISARANGTRSADGLPTGMC